MSIDSSKLNLNVVVGYPTGVISSKVNLNVVVGPGAIVTSIVPSKGGVGKATEVTITGEDLTPATGVLFGGEAATDVVVVNDTTITCKTPISVGAGAVDVTVQLPTEDVIIKNGFTFEKAFKVSGAVILFGNLDAVLGIG